MVQKRTETVRNATKKLVDYTTLTITLDSIFSEITLQNTNKPILNPIQIMNDIDIQGLSSLRTPKEKI